MNQLYTSYYGNVRHLDPERYYLVGTSTTIPKNITLAERWQTVTPSWNNMVKPIKNGLINEQEYTKRYKEQLAKNKDKIHSELWAIIYRAQKAGNKYPVFLCYEEPNKFCHRHLLADFIMFNNAVKVNEWDTPDNKPLQVVNTKDVDRFKPCVVLIEDTFDGKLTTYESNNKTINLSSPYKYIDHIYQLLKKKNPHYTITYIANKADNRILDKAIIEYGRRRLTYTNVNASSRRLSPRSDDQFLTYRIEQSHVTTWNIATKTEPAKWAQEKHNIWCSTNDKGGYDPLQSKWTQRSLSNGTVLISGKYRHKNKFKTLEYNSFVENKKYCITITTKETNISTNTIEPNGQVTDENGVTTSKLFIGKWINEIKAIAQKNGWTGEVYINVDKNGHYHLYGKWTKSWEVGKGAGHQKHFMTQIWSSDSIAREKQTDTTFSPSIKNTYTTFANEDETSNRTIKTASSRNYRSYKQDQDTHTPEQKHDLRKEQHRSINQEYRQYEKDMKLWDRILMVQREVEFLKNQNKKQPLTKPQNAAKLWLQKVLREEPEWLKKNNAIMLINYCLDCLKKGAMVGAEASKYCEQNAK